MMSSSIILTDLDNTIYNWVDYFAPSFRGMVHALSREAGISEELLYDQFREVYSRFGSVEYSFSVQELQLCRELPSSKVEELISLAKTVFSMVREKNLRPYDGVRETLEWAVREGITVIAVTNAPFFQAERRLSQLHLDDLFYGLAAWEGYAVPTAHDSTQAIKLKSDQGKYRSRVRRVWKLPSAELKPSCAGYARIISELAVPPQAVHVVGDSLHKDIAPAERVGAIGVWAKYGTLSEKKNFETLLRITHWSETKIAQVYNDSAIQPHFTINSFTELRGIVETPQLQLF